MGDHCCKMMSTNLETGETAIRYSPKFREYGIPVLDDGDSYIVIAHCPWCGSQLPTSLRDRWFEQLEKLGLDIDDPRMPEALRTDEWWKQHA